MKKLKEEFKKMLRSIGQDFPEEILTALFPIRGAKYKGELMVVGRAINGWGYDNDEISWKTKKGKPTDKTIENIIDYSFEEKGVCPMKWITDHWGWDTEENLKTPDKDQYNMKKKAFWRVIKEILSELKITKSEEEKKNWSSCLVWSNLYKVASPEGGNPSTRLGDAQREGCRSVLKEEISFFKPKRILFLTGHDWFEDFKDNSFEGKERTESLVEWVGNYGKTEVVVAKHPQGKDETEYVKQVIKYFQ